MCQRRVNTLLGYSRSSQCRRTEQRASLNGRHINLHKVMSFCNLSPCEIFDQTTINMGSVLISCRVQLDPSRISPTVFDGLLVALAVRVCVCERVLCLYLEPLPRNFFSLQLLCRFSSFYAPRIWLETYKSSVVRHFGIQMLCIQLESVRCALWIRQRNLFGRYLSSFLLFRCCTSVVRCQKQQPRPRTHTPLTPLPKTVSRIRDAGQDGQTMSERKLKQKRKQINLFGITSSSTAAAHYERQTHLLRAARTYPRCDTRATMSHKYKNSLWPKTITSEQTETDRYTEFANK